MMQRLVMCQVKGGYAHRGNAIETASSIRLLVAGLRPWQSRDMPWTEEEYIAALQPTAPVNVRPAEAILQWAHSDYRITVEGGRGAQNAGTALRTSRPNDADSEHTFIDLLVNAGNNASAEVQFASMARREPFVSKSKRIDLLNKLRAIATSV